MHGRSVMRAVSPGTYGEDLETVFRDSLSQEMEGGRWQNLVAGLGANTGHVVQLITDRLTELIEKRRITESDARWLLNPLQPLYQAGISAQKLSHFMGRAFHARRESVSLDVFLSDAVQHHTQTSPRHEFTQDLVPLTVVMDPDMLSSAIDSLLAWGEGLGGHLDLRLMHQSGQPYGELWLNVTKLFTDIAQDRNLNSVEWYILWQLARLKGIKVKRKVESDRIHVMVRFKRTMSSASDQAQPQAHGLEALERMFDPAGTEVWTLLPTRAMQTTVLGSFSRSSMKRPRVLRNINELADVSELPHCIVTTEKIIASGAFTYWRQFAQEAANRTIAVIEVTTESDIFEVGGFGPRSVVRLSAADVPSRLVSTIMFELERIAEA
jgi:hypothetical protein